MMARTTYGGRSLAREKDAKRTKRTAVILAVFALLTFVVHEILDGSLRRLDESLSKAESEFRSQSDLSTIQTNMELSRQEILAGQAATAQKNSDFSAMTRQVQAETRVRDAQMLSDFEDVSKFIDALPLRSDDLLAARDGVRKSVSEASKNTDAELTKIPRDPTDRAPAAAAELAFIGDCVREIEIVALEDLVRKTAQRERLIIDRATRVCRLVYWILGLSTALVVIYGAAKGLGAERG
jgi:hypothetical protein